MLSLLLNTIFILNIHVSGQCASHTSYCLTGLEPDDYASFIAAYYEYTSINEGCEYFINTQINEQFEHGDGDIYLHWDGEYNYWVINYDIHSADRYAYCYQSSLDSCTSGKWYIYDGQTSSIKYGVTIKPCHYNNTECKSNYNQPFSDHNNNEYDFCFRNAHHRETNNIGSIFSVHGCQEEKPYYTNDYDIGVEGYEDSVTTLAWDNELSTWFLSYTHKIAAHSNWAVAYCTYDNLNDCSGQWYIYDGKDVVQDSLVISGLCNTCTDIRYDEYCIYGGADTLIVGIYEWDSCHQLMSSYVHTQYSYYNLTEDDGNLTLHHRAVDNSFLINIEHNESVSYGWCEDQDDIMSCNGNWSIVENDEWILTDTIQSGSCDVIYYQCIPDTYLCINQHDNQDVIRSNANYLKYIAGQYKYLKCDDNGFPIYIREKDSKGNRINITSNDVTQISFNMYYNIFSVHNYHSINYVGDNNNVDGVRQDDDVEKVYDGHTHYLYCRSLLISLCDTFWNIYDSNRDEWVSVPSVRLTQNECNYPINEASFVEVLEENITWIIIAVLILNACCCSICLLIYYRKKWQRKQINSYNDKTPVPDIDDYDDDITMDRDEGNTSQHQTFGNPDPALDELMNSNQYTSRY